MITFIGIIIEIVIKVHNLNFRKHKKSYVSFF